MCQISYACNNLSTRYLLPNFVDFVDFVESVTDKKTVNNISVSAYRATRITHYITPLFSRQL